MWRALDVYFITIINYSWNHIVKKWGYWHMAPFDPFTRRELKIASISLSNYNDFYDLSIEIGKSLARKAKRKIKNECNYISYQFLHLTQMIMYRKINFNYKRTEWNWKWLPVLCIQSCLKPSYFRERARRKNWRSHVERLVDKRRWKLYIIWIHISRTHAFGGKNFLLRR